MILRRGASLSLDILIHQSLRVLSCRGEQEAARCWMNAICWRSCLLIPSGIIGFTLETYRTKSKNTDSSADHVKFKWAVSWSRKNSNIKICQLLLTVGGFQHFLLCCCCLVSGAVLKSTFMNVSLLHIKSNFMIIKQAHSPDRNECMRRVRQRICISDKLTIWRSHGCNERFQVVTFTCGFFKCRADNSMDFFCPPLPRQIYARLWLRSNTSPNPGRKLADILDIPLSPCCSGLTMPHCDRGCKLILASQRGWMAGDKWLHCWWG